MSWAGLKSLIRLLLAHHPLCGHYSNHLIHVIGIDLCLGCTGFYFGAVSGFIPILLGLLDKTEWFFLVLLAILLALPSILRLLAIPEFNSKNKSQRFIIKFLLGIGIIIGLKSIFIAPNPQIALIQFILGFSMFLAINIKRFVSMEKAVECRQCTQMISPGCPGLTLINLGKSIGMGKKEE